ncbi:ATPase P [Peribacillus asahii]|uniref:ATPase P n=1 Tax=Peribacillus asahii TaxID=228899 RepID=A0A3Q9RN37_9BACI|nr:ATPase P [Peribacillus asahii]
MLQNSVFCLKVENTFETTHHIDTVILDKTGTVTNGKPKLTDIFVENGVDEQEFLSLIRSSWKTI